MALFGDDVESNIQQPQQQSFFGNVGSFLWSAIKVIGVSVIALTGIGALFKNSDTLRSGLDNITPESRLGSKIANLYDKTKQAIFDPPAPTMSDVSETITVDGNKILKTDPKKLTLNNSENYEEMRNVNHAIANKHSAIYTKEEEKRALAGLTQKQDELLTHGLKYEAWNKAVDNYSKEYEGLLASGAVPTPPKVNLNALPTLSDSLNEYGKKTYTSGNWDDLTKIEQIKHLRDEIKRNPKEEPVTKYALDNGSPIDRTIYELHKLEIVSKLAKGDFKNGLDGHPLTPDEGIEATRIGNIKEAIKKGDLDDALKMSQEASAYFLKTGKALGNGKEISEEMREKGAQYAKASKNFGEWADYATDLKRQEEIKKVLGETNAVIIDTSKQISTTFAPHERQVEELVLAEKIRERRIAQGVNGNEPTTPAEKAAAPVEQPAPTNSQNTTPSKAATPETSTVGAGISGKENETVSSLKGNPDFRMLMEKVDSVAISNPLPAMAKKKVSGNDINLA